MNRTTILGAAFILAGVFIPSGAGAQNLTLEHCQALAQKNYPLAGQYGLIAATEHYNLSNASKGYLPQFNLSAKASYQSEVTSLPIDLPGVDTKMRKDQYQVMAQADQTIWDGGNIRAQRRLVSSQAETDVRQVDVGMYALRDRVNQLFFGILLLDAKLEQNRLLQDELQRSYGQVEAFVQNGVATPADLDAVKVSQLDATQRRKEQESTRSAYLAMLAALTGCEISEGSVFIRPQAPGLSGDGIKRPELALYEAMGRQLDTRRAALNAKVLPKIGAFVQGAYGNPGLNMLKNEFSAYYVAGVRLNWNFGGLYTRKNDLRLIEAQRGDLGVQRETFLFNTRLELTQQGYEAEKYRRLMEDDDRIVALRENIVRAARAQVEGGTMSVIEMLRQITDEDMARQDKALHEMQWLLSVYTLKNTANN